MMRRKYKSELLGSLHETAAGLYNIGVITEDEMRDYDRNCLVREKEAAYDAAPFSGKGASSRSRPASPALACSQN